MEQLERYSPWYGEFFTWVRQQGQDLRAMVERDVRLLLPVFEIGLLSREVFLTGCDAASRLELLARGAGALVSAEVFRSDYDYCCFMLGAYRRA